MANPERTFLISTHFRLEELTDGVYAAIADERGAAAGNAGIIDLGGETLVFDTFISPLAAEDLRLVAERVTGQPVTWVVNSHYHNDHIRGNQVFAAETGIIATETTRTLIKTRGVQELQRDTENTPARLHELEAQIAEESDEDKRANLAVREAYFRGINESLSVVKLRLPDHTFDGRLTLHGEQRAVEILSFGGGHTESDAILYLPDEGIAFMGDLLFVGCHPYLEDGDSEAWLESLEAARKLDLKTLVPGHGPVGSVSDLDLIRDYITELTALATRVIEDGGTRAQATHQPIPKAFADWRYGRFFPGNMRFLYRRLATHEDPEAETSRVSGAQLRALGVLYERLDGSGIAWALTGSMSFALQGVAVEPKGIDVQTDRTGAYAIAGRLGEYVSEPVARRTSERIHSLFGVLDIEGVRVEIMGDLQKRLEDYTWEAAPDLSQQRRYVMLVDMRVPVLSLEYEHEAYLKLGRTDRAELLKNYLDRDDSA